MLIGTKRKHKNTRRLTARERAEKCADEFIPPATWPARVSFDDAVPCIERALQAHAREAVARYKRKAADASVRRSSVLR